MVQTLFVNQQTFILKSTVHNYAYTDPDRLTILLRQAPKHVYDIAQDFNHTSDITPLHIASSAKSARYLLMAGANPLAKTSKDQTAWDTHYLTPEVIKVLLAHNNNQVPVDFIRYLNVQKAKIADIKAQKPGQEHIIQEAFDATYRLSEQGLCEKELKIELEQLLVAKYVLSIPAQENEFKLR